MTIKNYNPDCDFDPAPTSPRAELPDGVKGMRLIIIRHLVENGEMTKEAAIGLYERLSVMDDEENPDANQ